MFKYTPTERSGDPGLDEWRWPSATQRLSRRGPRDRGALQTRVGDMCYQVIV